MKTTAKTAKPPFEEINFNADSIRWGAGNKAVGLSMLARFQTRELTKAEEKAERDKYEEAKRVYNEFINVGQVFKPSGKTATQFIRCKITFIHKDKQTVTWRQINLSESEIARGYKPAAGKWHIDSMLALYRAKQIQFL